MKDDRPQRPDNDADEPAEPDQAQRSTQQALWVDIQVRQAMRQGERRKHSDSFPFMG